MRNHRILYALLGMALILDGCGAKPAMEGGRSDDSTEYGSVSESGGSEGAGNGDSTSFADDQVEKVDEYVVRSGDNLWNIAAKASVYRSGWLYPLILKANRSKITDPLNLKIGMTLKVPRELSKAEHDVAREEAMAGTFEKEVGTLLDMQTDVPTASPQAAVHVAAGKIPVKKGGWNWLLWLLVAILAGVGAWQLIKMRQRRRDDDARTTE